MCRRRRLRALALFGFGSLLSIGMLGSTAMPAAAQSGPTLDGTTMTVTISSNVPLTEYGWTQLPNEASLSCGPGSTTDATGGPQSNSLECVFNPAVTTATVIAHFTVAPTGPVTLHPFASSNNETYVVLPPVTVTPATPPAVTPTPTAGPTANAPGTNTNTETGGRSSDDMGSPWFWFAVCGGVVLIAIGLGATVSGSDTDDSLGMYPDYPSGDGLPLPPSRHSPIPGLAYGGDVVEPAPAGPDGDQDDPEGTGTESTGTETDWEEAKGDESKGDEDPPPLRTPIG